MFAKDHTLINYLRPLNITSIDCQHVNICDYRLFLEMETLRSTYATWHMTHVSYEQESIHFLICTVFLNVVSFWFVEPSVSLVFTSTLWLLQGCYEAQCTMTVIHIPLLSRVPSSLVEKESKSVMVEYVFIHVIHLRVHILLSLASNPHLATITLNFVFGCKHGKVDQKKSSGIGKL